MCPANIASKNPLTGSLHAGKSSDLLPRLNSCIMLREVHPCLAACDACFLGVLSCHPASHKPPIICSCRTCASRALHSHRGRRIPVSDLRVGPTAAEADFDHRPTSDGSTSHSSQGGCPWWPRRFQVVRRAELYPSRKLSWPLSYGSSGTVAEGP